MNLLIELLVTFVYTAILWVVVLVIYNTLFEPFDFGPLSWFAAKSAILITVIVLFTVLIPFGSFVALIAWWIGLMVVFNKDFWECRILVMLIWGVNFGARLMIRGFLLP